MERARTDEPTYYSTFADALGLGSPRNLGWLLTPMLDWCRDVGLPLLPIIVVGKATDLPSGPYDRATIEAETRRVREYDWSAVSPPGAADLLPFALPPVQRTSRGIHR